MDRESNIVRSGLSGRVNQDLITLEVEIYRLEDDPSWALEVVDHTGRRLSGRSSSRRMSRRSWQTLIMDATGGPLSR